MQLQLQGFRTEPGSPVHEALAAVRNATVAAGGERPWLVAYTPVARMNPYQALTYRHFGDEGLAVSPVLDPESFEALIPLMDQTRGIVLHLHWLNTVLRGAKSEQQAEALMGTYLERLRRFRDAGGRLVWTVHNLAPHDAVYLNVERALQQSVADLADIVHVMSEDTAELVADFLVLDPARTVVSAHPSYLGAYPDVVPRDQARTMLGLHEDEVVYVVFGAIKAYKGIETLVAGFDRLVAGSDVPRRLVIAGGPDRDARTRRLLRRLRMHPHVLLHDVKVPNDQVQYLLRAADLMVLPHQVALNSGAAMLGPSFDLPLVANRVGVLPGTLDGSFTEFLTGSAPDDVAASLQRADRLLVPEARAAARAFAARHHAERVSADLARQVRDRLGAGTGVFGAGNPAR
ncbi:MULTISPECIES: glycosyltransferase [Micrococcaceae]|uniref:glycosyltransferase n=1 Tax=Micrococcaceae TaxID=1268 RepID=UPI00162141C6|nr:glycosyltransferase [Citricoccus sp.]MBB5748457.1 glycosyltransferase involved in cell wall biosynthesis [Micrococcus sp. TA1]HRO30943.1 glycosyltransferase [Citricoccus sp.]HRO93638.1 glycosyltransferase [Citricoccus sp.]